MTIDKTVTAAQVNATDVAAADVTATEIIDQDRQDATADVDRIDPSTPSSAKLACRIEGVARGVVSGRVIAYAAIDLNELLFFVGRRGIGRTAISWAASAGALDRDGREGTFQFDLRVLPPDLLLAPRLKVDVRAGRDATTALTKIDLDTADLYPASALAKGKGRLEGLIDSTQGGMVRGWVWDPAAPERRIQLQLFIGGLFCGLFEASAPRPDVRDTGRGDGLYGFAIPAEEFFARAGTPSPQVELVSLEPELWRVPLAAHAKPRRRAIRWPRARQIPQTARELAALLVSTEPFPKKVYALDRLTQKMPDAFSADYLLLGLEFLRVEMVKTGEAAPSRWSEHLRLWWRRRLIRGQIERLAALAQAAAAAKTILDRTEAPQKRPAPAKARHEGP